MTPLTQVVCEGCGACCYLEVLLSPSDVTRLRRVADILTATKVCEGCWASDVTGERLVNPRAILRRRDGACRFLDETTKRCGVYDHRPGVCRGFEFGGSECDDVRDGTYVGLHVPLPEAPE